MKFNYKNQQKKYSSQGNFSFDYDSYASAGAGGYYDEDGFYVSESYKKSKSIAKNIWDSSKNYASKGISASARWASQFKDYSSDLWKDLSVNEQKHKKMKRELSAVARSVNSVRNFGENGKEQKIVVCWADEGQQNNVVLGSEIFLSPDVFGENSLKSYWSEDQKRDVLIGEALTLVGMKRMTQPHSVLMIKEAMQLDQSELEQNINSQNHPILDQKTLLRMITSNLWKGVEQNASRTNISSEYRGSTPYFAAVQSYYSDEKLKDELTKIADFLSDPSIPFESKIGSSINAARIIAWNINQIFNPSESIPLSQSDFGFACTKAMGLVMDAMDESTTRDRFKKCKEAALVLIELEPPVEFGSDDNEDDNTGESDNKEQENQEKSEDSKSESEKNKKDSSSQSNKKQFISETYNNLMKQLLEDRNGSQVTATSAVENKDSVNGFQDVDEVEDELSEGLKEASANCSYHLSKERMDNAFEAIKKIREANLGLLKSLNKRLEPISEKNVLPEHGLRSGKLSGNKLWKVTVDTTDNDRIFHRNNVSGYTRELQLGLLLDFSGSMIGRNTEIVKKIGVLLHDALSEFHGVHPYFYAHQEKTEFNDITEFAKIENLAVWKATGGTNEGGAYAYCARQLIQRGAARDRKVLMSIGDGHTNGEEIKEAVNLARKGGVETLCLLIKSTCSPEKQVYDAYGKESVVCLDVHSKDLEQEILIRVQPWLVKTLNSLKGQKI